MNFFIRHCRVTGRCVRRDGTSVEFELLGSAGDNDARLAARKANAEATERGVAHSWDASTALWLTPQDALARKERFVEPWSINRSKRSLSTHNVQRELPWVSATALRNDESVFVPAASVWIGTSCDPAIPHLLESTSNGLAAGSTPQRAETSALTELVERHDIQAWWWGLTPGRRIRRAEELIPIMARRSLQYEGFLLSSIPGIWTVILFAYGSLYALGAGSHTDKRVACRHAALELEAGLAQAAVACVSREVSSADRDDARAVNSLRDRYDHYSNPQNLMPSFDRLRSNRVIDSHALATTREGHSASAEETRMKIRRALTASGHQVFLSGLGDNRGISVVRAVSTTMAGMIVSPKEQPRSVLIDGRMRSVDVDDRAFPHPVY